MINKFKIFFYVFSIVTTCVLIAVAMFTTILFPAEMIEPVVLWQILLVSGLCALGSMIIWNSGRISGKRRLAIWTMIHYLYCNVVVLGAGSLFEWYNATSPKSLAAMVISVAVIYVVVTVISWRKSAKDAEVMNARLEEYQKEAEL